MSILHWLGKKKKAPLDGTVLSGHTGDARPTAEALLRLAREAQEQGNLEVALDYIAQAIQADPSGSAHLVDMAANAHRMDLFSRAALNAGIALIDANRWEDAQAALLLHPYRSRLGTALRQPGLSRAQPRQSPRRHRALPQSHRARPGSARSAVLPAVCAQHDRRDRRGAELPRAPAIWRMARCHQGRHTPMRATRSERCAWATCRATTASIRSRNSSSRCWATTIRLRSRSFATATPASATSRRLRSNGVSRRTGATSAR